MNIADARAKAEEALRHMQEMNASYEHVPSQHRAYLASTVIDLCSQLETAQNRIAELEAEKIDGTEPTKRKKKAAPATDATEPVPEDHGEKLQDD